MKKEIGIMAALAAFLVLALFASAHGGWNGMNMMGMNAGMHGMYHEQVEEVLEEGTYQDLLDLREEFGMPFMRWVDSEEDFQFMQEKHELMEQFHEEYGRGPGMVRGHCWMN